MMRAGPRGRKRGARNADEVGLRRAIDSADLAICTVGLPGGRVEYASPAAARLLRSTDDPAPAGLRRRVLPDARRAFDEAWSTLLSGRRPPDIEYPIEDSGSSVRWLHQHASLEGAADGRPKAAQVVLHDVTARREAEEALRLSEERFRVAFRTQPDAVNLNRLADGRYVDVNEGFVGITGYTRDEVIGKTSAETGIWSNPEDREGLVVALARDGQVTDYKARFRMKDGRIVIGAMSARLLTIADEPHILSITRDITEQSRLEEEREVLQARLLQAQKLESVGRLAGGVAHDFNNMLHIIQGFATLLKLRLPEEEKTSRYLEEIDLAVRRGQGLIRQLLAFSRRQMISPVPSDLNQLIERFSGALSRLIGEDIELRVEAGDALWAVNVDPAQVDQILLNLAVNARDAMPRGGKLRVETANVRLDESHCRRHPEAKEGDHVLLVVADDGMGMDAETVSRIFEPFFTTKEGGKGTGLGLATVYGIVEQNGGFVSVHSEPGEGTTFRIYLPRTAETESAEHRRAEESEHVGTGTVLVVEDEESVRHLTTALLDSIGYTVVTAADPAEALELFRQGDLQIDVVLTDVVMPGMNGAELRDRLDEIRPGVRVVFTSGYAPDVIAHHGVLERGVHFLPKPFGIADLARKLAEVLAAS